MTTRIFGGSAKAMGVKRRTVADAALERVSETSSVSSITTVPSILSNDSFVRDEQDNRENIKVSVRIRPLLRNENDANETVAYSWDKNTITQLNSVAIQQQASGKKGPAITNGGRPIDVNVGQPMPSHIFDFLFYPEDTNQHIYDNLVRDIVIQAMQGFHGSVFAYGQTASGKTFTMHGTKKLPGIIPMAISDCFDEINSFPDREFLFRVSYLEVYNEQVHDLLNAEPTQIKIQYDPKIGTVLTGVKEMVVVTSQQVIAMIESGEAQRHVGATDMNEKSSRAHSLFKLIIESHSRSAGANSPVRVSTLNLVDLAGSENAKMTNAKGTRALEAKYINQSLLTLSTIIQRLSEEKPGHRNRQHYPYRDSKLTRLMQAALSGNAQIAIICTISPAASCIEETNNTLKFASRAKRIKMESKINETMDDKTLLRQYREEIEQLKAKLNEMEHMMLSGKSSLGTASDMEDVEEEERADSQTVMLQMIDHMERLILKSDALTTPSSNTQPVTPASKPATQPGDTSFFVRKPHIRKNSVENANGKVDGIDDTRKSSQAPLPVAHDNEGDDDGDGDSGDAGFFESPSPRGMRSSRASSTDASKYAKDLDPLMKEAAHETDTVVLDNPATPTAVLSNVTSILNSLREQVAKSVSKQHKRMTEQYSNNISSSSSNIHLSPPAPPTPRSPRWSTTENQFSNSSTAMNIKTSFDESQSQSQVVADLMLQIRLLEADNRFLQDAVERKDQVMERLTEGLKDVQRVQDELVQTNMELAMELDDTRRALKEAAQQLWDMTQDRDRLFVEVNQLKGTPIIPKSAATTIPGVTKAME